MLREDLIDVIKRFNLTSFRSKKGKQGIFRNASLIWKLELNIKNLIFSFIIIEIISYFQNLECQPLQVTLLQKCFALHLEHCELLVEQVH